MNYCEIKKTDIADGPGVRVSLFVSGCTHHCPGCFNAETWNFSFGKKYTIDTEKELLEAVSYSYISGLTVLGGEPFEPVNQRFILPILKKIKKEFPQKNIWFYTGYLFDTEIMPYHFGYLDKNKEVLKKVEAFRAYLSNFPKYPKENELLISGIGINKDTGRHLRIAHCEVTDELVDCIDVIVDGPFVLSKKNLSLKFRGSSNQRIIDVKESLKRKEIILLKLT